MYVDDTIDRITQEAVEKCSAKWIAPGSILFVTRSGILRRKLPVGLTKSKVTVNQDIKAFTPVDILPEYAYYYSLSVSEQIRRECAKDGTTVESIDTKKLYNFPITYPSLPEQRTIVSKLEGLLSALDRSVLELEGARARLGVYRMSVLREAFVVNKAITHEHPLEEIADSCLGKMLDKKKNEGDYQPYLANINVRWGKFNLDKLREMRFKSGSYDRYGLEDGDIVMCEGGEPGRCAVWKGSSKMYIQKALHRIRPKSGYSSEYLFHYFEYAAQVKIIDRSFTGTTIKHLTGRKLKTINIPLPDSLPEQHQIVAEIESRLSVAEVLEREIEMSLERARGLRMGVLQKAFGGGLLTEGELAELPKE